MQEKEFPKLIFQHQLEKEKVLKYAKKLKLSPLTIFMKAVREEKLKIKAS